MITTCKSCKKQIEYNGKHWVHTTYSPRHIAVPEDYCSQKEESPTSSCSTETAGCAAIGDVVTVRMSRGGYRLKLTTQEQVDIVNNELLQKPAWNLEKCKI